MKVVEIAVAAMREGYICDHCLGRLYANLLTGMTNRERGKIVRRFIALLTDSGEKIKIDDSNLIGIKLRNVRLEKKEVGKCKICGNFFEEKIDDLVEKIVEEVKDIEFDTFLIGSIPTDEMLKNEEKIWEMVGVEYVESIKSEINREIGKKVRKILGKTHESKVPDVSIIVDLKRYRIKVGIRSLYIYGEYKKLKRGIPQAKWLCPNCRGKGCRKCKGTGKLYRTSVQEIIEKPLLKVTKGERTKFSGMGREDIDARCLDYRPFVIEVVKPKVRKIKLKEIERKINKSKMVKVRKLKFVTKDVIRRIKSARVDKTYRAIVTFKRKIDPKKLAKLRELVKEPIMQKTPLRVIHRRADKLRKRRVRSISWKILGKRKLELKIRGETGLYIKELINGDKGRTKPSVAEILENDVKDIKLDVVKIHAKGIL